MIATMISMIDISTKAGDLGKTNLANGLRMSKADPYFDAIGDLDELNSWLGVAISHLKGKKVEPEKQFLFFLQKQLFVIGAEVAQADGNKISSDLLQQIETHSQHLQKKMIANWHNKFLYPGGTQSAAWLDVARTVCRRTERTLVKLSKKRKIRSLLLKVINRLSDYLFVLRCFVNCEQGYQEKLSE